MNKLLTLVVGLYWIIASNALSGQSYMEKFTQYTLWSQELPDKASSEFLAFIRTNSPLATKLREKWLYHLATAKDWTTFNANFQNSDDSSLKCYAQIARFQLGFRNDVFEAAKPLWLVGESQPEACNQLFSLMFSQDNRDEDLITQRIALALEKRNLQLARYLLKQYKHPRLKDEQLLFSIYRDPTRIAHLETGELHDDFYLYGLKRMVSRNMDLAIQYWQHVRTKKLLSEAQQQAFLAHISLYKAMRGHDDSYAWFKKIKPEYYNDALINWQIRFALKRKNWRQVQRLIRSNKEQDNLCWQYWLARALEAQGQKNKAQKLYQALSKNRHYYGFLASVKLRQNFEFDNENPVMDMMVLQPYQPFLNEIKALYQSNQTLQASRRINDFMSELPKDEASALAYWIGHELQWYGKSVYLSNSTEILNDQLALRFPLYHRETVKTYAQTYTIQPEFIYAIIRQESAFRDDVTSRVGARGLMQIMPATAKLVTKKEKIAYRDQRQLFDLSKNINIGVAYLQELSGRFERHPVLMAAAYNAGPRRVDYWLKNHPPKEVDIWIETLPWHETRNYLKNVIAFYLVYQYRMNKAPNLKQFMTLI